jgi:hypothetical protein
MVSTALDRSKQAEDDLTANPSLTRGGARGELAGSRPAAVRVGGAVCVFPKIVPTFCKMG